MIRFSPPSPFRNSAFASALGVTLMFLGALGNQRAAAQTASLSTTHHFVGTDGAGPIHGLIKASDGNLYGTAFSGGTNSGTGPGVIYRVSATGSDFTVIHFFGGSGDGSAPRGGVIQASDGKLYGTTRIGGSEGHGVFYRMELDGGSYTVLYNFVDDGVNGILPNGVTQASDGNFYGSSNDGGSIGNGTLFRLTPGGAITTLFNFTGRNGRAPRDTLTVGSDGNVYGTTPDGGTNEFGGGSVSGICFRITVASGAVDILHNFTSAEAAGSTIPLTLAGDGNFYAITPQGGSHLDGTVLRISQDGTTTIIHEFDTNVDDQLPFTPLTLGTDGHLYGGTAGTEFAGGDPNGKGTLFRISTSGTFATIYRFPSDGSQSGVPDGPMVQTASNTFIGTANGGDFDLGSVFALTISTARASLLNISTRLQVDTGDNILIAGFIVTGTDNKNVIVRARGPSLSDFGIAGALGDTTLELHDGNGALIATNDNWKINDQTGQSQEAAVRATTVQPSNDLESAILSTLPPGSYTAVVRGKNNTTGIAVVEAYDLNASANSTAANISTRGFVNTGDNILIAGFIVGNANAGVIIRAIGPSLTAFGIAGALPDPTLELHDPNGTLIATNDNWKINDQTGQSQETAVRATTLQPTNDFESVIVSNLAPGAYTAVVRGKNNTTGIAVVQVYNLQ